MLGPISENGEDCIQLSFYIDLVDFFTRRSLGDYCVETAFAGITTAIQIFRLPIRIDYYALIGAAAGQFKRSMKARHLVMVVAA